MPSFAEGFGLPVAEALQLGTPVLCSDIAAHREIAEGVAEFIDPLDGPGWMQADPGLRRSQVRSTLRMDQLRKLARVARADMGSACPGGAGFSRRDRPMSRRGEGRIIWAGAKVGPARGEA